MKQQIVLLLISSYISCLFCQVIIAKNTQVTPRCGSQLISIEVNFDASQWPGGKFTDWIIVGVSGRPECRLRGNGETKYIIEIAVFNDPCLTQIPARNVFQNRIRIGKNPVVILEEDQSVTVKCVYGLPTVETMTLPIINSNFNIDNFNNPEPGSTSFNTSERIGGITKPMTSMNVDVSAKESIFQTSETADPDKRLLGSNGLPPNSETSQLSPTHEQEHENNGNVNPNQFTKVTDNLGGWNSRNTMAPKFELENRNGAQNMNNVDISSSMSENMSNFGLTSSENSKKRSFSMIFIIAVIFTILFFLLLFGLCLMCWKKKLAIRNRRLLVDRVSDRTWPAVHSSDEYASSSPRTTYDKSKRSENQKPSPGASFGKSLFKTEIPRVFNDRTTIMESNNTLNYSDNKKRTSVKLSRKKGPTPTPNLPLKSNLEEFVSKTHALGEYNNLASPAYAYTSEIHDEREVDVGNDHKYEKPYEKRDQHLRRPRTEDQAVSSFRSITEIVHAAETATTSKEIMGNGDNSDMVNVLMDCVLPIRGFGYRKLTEQEIIRWKNLIHQDANIRKLLISSKSSAEIENIFEHEEYKNMFTTSKWHEIALCVHRVLTNSLDRTNSRSELQLFVGNVQTDW